MDRRIRRTVGVFAVLLVLAGSASADVLWNWSFATESGTFQTDGTLADTAGSHTFQILQFHVATSTVSANVGAAYVAEQPTQGMVWSGSAPTEFFRDSGSLTNGSNFTSVSNGYRYGLFPGVSRLLDAGEVDVTAGDLIVTPGSEVEIPSVPAAAPAGLALLAALVAGAGFAFSRSRP
jgi:hypothetical protein